MAGGLVGMIGHVRRSLRGEIEGCTRGGDRWMSALAAADGGGVRGNKPPRPLGER